MEPTTVNRTHPSCCSGDPEPGGGMLRLSVAPGCNMSCRFCLRRGDGLFYAGAKPRIMTPEAAIDRVSALIDGGASPACVEIAGPGEPLVNAETFTVLAKLHWLYPGLPFSVQTNGLLLPERLGDLVRDGASSLTVSIHAIAPATAERIHTWIIYRGRRLEGREGAEVLLHQQWSGLQNAIEAGLPVTVNTIQLPGTNDQDIPLIIDRVRELGAEVKTMQLTDRRRSKLC